MHLTIVPANSNLQIIGKKAFSFSKLKEIFIPPNVSKICKKAFYYCFKLRKVEIPTNSNLQIIESNAFSYSNIISFFIPSSVSNVSEKSFQNCKNLQIIEISEKLESLPFFLIVQTL